MRPWFHHHFNSNSVPEMQLQLRLIHLIDQRRFVGQFQFHASPANGVWASPCPFVIDGNGGIRWILFRNYFDDIFHRHSPTSPQLWRTPICQSRHCTWFGSCLSPWSSEQVDFANIRFVIFFAEGSDIWKRTDWKRKMSRDIPRQQKQHWNLRMSTLKPKKKKNPKNINTGQTSFWTICMVHSLFALAASLLYLLFKGDWSNLYIYLFI